MPDSLKSVLLKGAKLLHEHGIEQALLDARLLLEAATKLRREELLMHGEQPIQDDAKAKFEEMLGRRCCFEPVSRIIGRRGFWNLDLQLNAETLDPRADTETIVEHVLDQRPKTDETYKILDLGTGSGCIVLALLSEYKNSSGLAVDISHKAIDQAKQNSILNHLDSRATFIQADWVSHGTAIAEHGPFDIITSNPPYILSADISALQPDVREFDPHTALDGGADGLDAYRQLCALLPRLLKQDGLAVFEIGQGQETDLGKIAHQHNLSLVDMKRDLSGIIRSVAFKRS